MKVIITGATSGLGRSLAENLQKEGHEVIAIGRNKEIGKLLEESNIRFISCDLGHEELNINHIDNVFSIIHCAALSSPWGRYQQFYKCNVVATQNIINVCHRYNINRLIHISSPSVYFNFESRFNIKEEDALPSKPINHYVRTKLKAEELINHAYMDGIQTICLRPRAIIGPYDQAIIPRLFRVYKNQRLPLINNGEAVIDYSVVDNVIEAIKLGLKTNNLSVFGKTYNISNGMPISIRELVRLLFNGLQHKCNTRSVPYTTAYLFAAISELVCRVLPISIEPLMTRYSVGVMAKSQTLDISLAKSLLKYEPQVSIEEAIEKYSPVWKKYLG